MLPSTTREAARRFGDRTAYVLAEGWALSYRDLDRISDEVAAGLALRGIAEGDVVALVLPPGADYLLAYLGAAKLGAVTAGVNDRLSATERTALLERADPALVLAGADTDTDTDTDTGTVRGDVVVVEGATGPDTVLRSLRVPGAAPPALPLDPDRSVAVVFTSGTTGTPKGALFTNRQLAFVTHTDVGERWGAGGTGLAGTSFAHLGFMTKTPGNLRKGGTTHVLARWRADAALALASQNRMTTLAGVPTQLALMLRHPRFDDHDLESVRFLVAGGGPITPGLAEEARRRFGARLATRYSCTEAGLGLGTAFDDPEEDAVVSVGRPLPGVELALLDEHDDPVSDGQIGQVCLRSPAAMREYWRDPDATARAFAPGGFVRTGDLGRRDDQGRLRLAGRTKEMYVRGGYNVYPVEVEAALSTHPAVAAVAVVPRPDPVMGEVGVAVVVAEDPGAPPALEDLRAHAGPALARHELPEAIVVTAALPLTAMEKVDRAALARLVADDDR